MKHVHLKRTALAASLSTTIAALAAANVVHSQVVQPNARGALSGTHRVPAHPGISVQPGTIKQSTPTTNVNAQKSNLHGHISVQSAPSPAWESQYAAGDQLYHSGKYEEAYKVWGVALKAAEADGALGKCTDWHHVEALKHLALMYKTQEKPAQASQAYEKLVTICSKTWGARSEPVADSMVELGRMYTFYEDQKNYARAEELLNEAFQIKKSIHGLMTIPAGDVAMILSQLMEKKKDFKKAIEYHKLVIEIGDLLEPNAVSCCRIGPRQGLSRCYEETGQLDSAASVHEDLIAMCKRGAPSMLPTVYNAYADCLQKMGRSEAAAQARKEAATGATR